MAWYYIRDGATQGPVELTELQNLHQGGVIAVDTPVWTEGMADWTTFQHTPAALATTSGAPLHTCAQCGKMFPADDMVQYENSWVCAACKPIFFQRLKEGVALPGTLAYASIGRRFLAILLDGILLYIVELIPAILVGGVAALSPTGRQEALGVVANLLLVVFNLCLSIGYEIFLIGKYGATFGKMAMKVKVVAPDGSPISYGRATGRYFAKMLSGVIFAIGYLMAFWDPEKRALHDRLCDTRVISTQP